MHKGTINDALKTKISKFMSYLLRHNPMKLKMDEEGFVNFEEFLNLVQKKYISIKREDLMSVARQNERYEIIDDRIRAIYGHSIGVSYNLNQVKIDKLYHGTTQKAIEGIMKEGLKPMKRLKVHLSSNIEAAIRVGKRRTANPIILEIDAISAVDQGIKIEKATDKVYLTDFIPPKFIKILKTK